MGGHAARQKGCWAETFGWAALRRGAGLISALTLLGALAACGSTTPTKTAQTTTTIPSAAQLKVKLLAVSDVGAGWRVGEAINPQDLASVGQSVPCSNVALDPTVAKRLTAVTGIQFDPTDRSSRNLIELVITGQPRQLDADLQALSRAFDSCSAHAATATSTTKLTVKKLAIPNLGDQRGAYVVTEAEESSGAWYSRGATVRIGTVAVVVGLVEVLYHHATPQISDATFVKILETAVAKLTG